MGAGLRWAAAFDAGRLGAAAGLRAAVGRFTGAAFAGTPFAGTLFAGAAFAAGGLGRCGPGRGRGAGTRRRGPLRGAATRCRPGRGRAAGRRRPFRCRTPDRSTLCTGAPSGPYGPEEEQPKGSHSCNGRQVEVDVRILAAYGAAQGIRVLVEGKAPHPQERYAKGDEQGGPGCGQDHNEVAAAVEHLDQGGQVAGEDGAKKQVQDHFLKDGGGQDKQAQGDSRSYDRELSAVPHVTHEVNHRRPCRHATPSNIAVGYRCACGAPT
ncbi:hypothetical protein AAHB33_03665 [Paenarthrobacter sp. S56]|uniref:hypothetical protein n=1 Tax=Paenarthrobacter sp. S56 TaxID=3138179 RepID=UPI00321A9E1C